ncbi:NADPH-dependent glutamate synthase [Agathobaculum sp. NTUH-O15-33]|uniref:NADPH-dependent glutamate synthase n=1 Tax=Agathobaculum sp. NTUH-O15-33 TaxID=3079302 RepID=UPI0029587E3A|nr:NADPH-dependent glutamate synthase [Agathobaculum sp. NTUH-O15-33]WNX83462.1 NADPH-dependent glutamate synthase [Agathobaculum sp. NTUH-O15-33]
MPNMNPKKMPMPEQPADVRNKNFEEVTLGYTPEMAIEEAQRCLNCKNKPCIAGCPVQVKIPEFIALVAEGKFLEAAAKIKETSALPAVCGRVCPQESQCECKCVRGIKGEPVAIGRLERFAADYAREHGEEKAQKPEPNGHKCAIVGAGPAGLTCAGDLARMGYAVTVFEALHTAGGVLMYGIPEFRLPKAIVQKEIDTLKDLGVEFVLDFVVGRSETIDELFADGYEAIFVGSGAGLPTFIGVPGENANGVYSANEYLTRINLMKAYQEGSPTPIQHAHKVAVVGGGNVAMDAARCAKRMGAEEVYIVYRRSEKELPARLEEIEHAKEEGVVFKFLTAPLEVLSDENYSVTGMKCQQMELGEPDESGRRRPVPVEGSEFTLDLDCVIAAIGTSPNPLIRTTTPGLDTNRKGCIVADDEHGITSKDGVFAGGDAVTGAATVILAMGAGKRAAAAMDAYIKNK